MANTTNLKTRLVLSFVIVLLFGNVQTVLANSVTLYGVLRYDGRPMSEITDVPPTFVCTNRDTGQLVSDITSTYNNNTAVYSISGLPLAKVAISVIFHIRGSRSTFPGNYYVSVTADIPNLSLDQRVSFDIGLVQRIHMTSPWDNDAVNPLTYDPTSYPAAEFPKYCRCLYFVWDAVPGATQYQIQISVSRDPYDHPDGYGRVGYVVNASVQGTTFLTILEPSEDLHHYGAAIFAYDSEGNLLGDFHISYPNGHGWDYRFKVISLSDADEDCLSDDDELIYGTDPDNPDTDGDGLLDGMEVEMAQGSGCPNPFDPDSDDDTLTDGDEVLNLETNPCDPDTDGDGMPDDADPLPKDPQMGTTIYVDEDATGANNGSSWADAYRCLQNALAAAQVGDEIRVAQGTYKPDQTAIITAQGPRIVASGDRKATFQLVDGVSLKGGYAGISNPNPDVRDIEAYVTILSGDLDGNDGPNFTNNGDNSYHVVNGNSRYAILDGFTITAGNANGQDAGDYNLGGGMYSNNSFNLRVRNCVFLANSASYGGGIFNNPGSSPKLFGCRFIGNEASVDGGGMAGIAGTSPYLINCIFSRNSAIRMGGGTFNLAGGQATIINCTFSSNSAETGGAIASSKSSSSTLRNCILWGNTAKRGLQIALYEYSSVAISYCDLQSGQPGMHVDPDCQTDWGPGNINADPLFIDAAKADYHLQPDSPCIDAGDNSAIPQSEVLDLGGNARIINGIVDMGAYEFGMATPLVNPLTEALDTDLSFTTGGDEDWFSQTATYYHDYDAAQSGDITHDQESWLQTTVNGAGTLNFYWKVSSEESCDYLEFYIDNVREDRISDSEDWDDMTYEITGSALHTLEWRYVKDGTVSEGDDCGWVDKVVWTPEP